MLLRAKVVLAVSILYACFLGLTYLVHQRTMIPHFLQLEKQELEKSMSRLRHGIDNQVASLTRMAHDYGYWDDTYEFVVGGSKDYIESNLVPGTFSGNEVNLICIVRTTGRILWSGGMNLEDESALTIEPFTSERMPLGHVLMSPGDPDGSSGGLIATEHGPMLIASEPILTSEEEGPSRGRFIFGKLLNDEVLSKIASDFALDAVVSPFEPAAIDAGLRSRMTEAAPVGDPIELDDGQAAILSVLRDVSGEPYLTATVRMPRVLLAEGRHEARFAMIFFMSSGLLVLFILLWFLNQYVLKRLDALGRQVSRIRDTGDASLRIDTGAEDEIGELGDSLNLMLTELQRVQDNLHKSEERLELALGGAELGLWDWNPSTGHCVFNRRWTEMLGYNVDEIRPHVDAWRELIHPNDIERADQCRDDHISGKSPTYETTYRLRHKSGIWRWIMVRGKTVLRDASGKAQRMSGTHLDITDFREAEARYRMLFEQMYSGFAHLEVTFDSKGEAEDARFLVANPAFERHTGLKSSEIIGKTLRQVLTKMEDGWMKAFREVVSTGKPARIEGYWRALDRHLSISAFSPTEGQIGIVVLDVTEQSRARLEQEELEEKFRQAQKLESLGVLAGGIAHDFNNLLMGILGNTELARDDVPAGGPADVSLREIELAAKRAADLCRQMLAYSGKGTLAIEPVNLNELITEIGELLTSSISKKSRLGFNLMQDLPTIEADASQIRQIVMNLIINASEALGEVPGQVILRTKMRACDSEFLSQSYIEQNLEPGEYVCLEVQDSGFGMDRETRQRIFDPFFTTKFTGRGLGLAAVMGIVRGHHGAIMVDSEPRKGSIFTVLFPVSGKPVLTPGSEDIEPFALGSATKVLLVDDEGTVRVAASRMLESLGFEVLLARDGHDALTQFQAQAGDIDCVILDLTMPQLDGGETLRLLRDMDGDIPVILSSGFDEEQVQQHIAGMKTSGFLQKPYQIDRLRSVLRDALS